jgi:hypothetical protein
LWKEWREGRWAVESKMGAGGQDPRCGTDGMAEKMGERCDAM